MANEIAYADLNIQEVHSFSSVPAPHPCQNSGSRQCTQWHRVALRVACTLNLILTVALTLLAIWVWGVKGLQNKETFEVTAVNSRFRLELKVFVCKPQENSKEEDIQDCKICPKDWLLSWDNCYWFSQESNNWTASQDDCQKKNATLIVIQNLEEMAFIKNQTEDGFWLGLMAKPSAGWSWEWVDGSPLKKELFAVSGSTQENSCGMINKEAVYSYNCNSVSRWVCEKRAFQI